MRQASTKQSDWSRAGPGWPVCSSVRRAPTICTAICLSPSTTIQYLLPLMGRYRHELIDAEAGVYRYDHLIVLHSTRKPAVLLEAGSIINRQEELELAT